MNILEQCKKCEKRPMCRLGEHEYYQVAFENGCPSFKQKQVKTVPITNFDLITESPEELAEKIIHLWFDTCHRFVWLGIDDDGCYEAFRKKADALESTLKYLNKEAEE